MEKWEDGMLVKDREGSFLEQAIRTVKHGGSMCGESSGNVRDRKLEG